MALIAFWYVCGVYVGDRAWDVGWFGLANHIYAQCVCVYQCVDFIFNPLTGVADESQRVIFAMDVCKLRKTLGLSAKVFFYDQLMIPMDFSKAGSVCYDTPLLDKSLFCHESFCHAPTDTAHP